MAEIIPDIPKLSYRNYKNVIQYWGFFTKEEIETNKGKLLMMDIDFGRYCSLNCPTCFRKSNIVDDSEAGDLSYDELLFVIDEARELGLRTIKICGAGESTQNTKFFGFVRELDKRGIGVSIFTKGQVLGDDEEAKKFYRSYGISSAKELCQEFFKLKVSFMLSFQSFDTNKQDQLVGKEGHALIRNQALANLIEAGFNSCNPTRLALVNAPITRTVYNEVLAIYAYARERNIYPVIAALMVSGKQINKEYLEKCDLTEEQKIDLWTKIYEWNIKHGVQTLDEIRRQGASAMPGIHSCNQIACGLYLTANGNVVGCPGFNKVEGNVKRESIKDIWERSQNFKMRRGVFNCHCPPKDGITLPDNLYKKVLANLE
jgi:MoaA/NifB/PqqE/SkfB family radical SAM enzyme